MDKRLQGKFMCCAYHDDDYEACIEYSGQAPCDPAEKQQEPAACPSIREAAKVIGKDPGTLHRWKTTNPHLYRAVMEYVERYQADKPESDEPANTT